MFHSVCALLALLPQVVQTVLDQLADPWTQTDLHAGRCPDTEKLVCFAVIVSLLEEKKQTQTLLLTSLAFSRHFGQSLLLTVVSWRTRQAAVQTLSHGLWVVVSTRTRKLGGMPCAYNDTMIIRVQHARFVFKII